MDSDDSDHERLYEDVRLPGSASKRKDRSAVGQTWRSLNEKAAPNQARVDLGSSFVIATWRSVNARAVIGIMAGMEVLAAAGEIRHGV